MLNAFFYYYKLFQIQVTWWLIIKVSIGNMKKVEDI